MDLGAASVSVDRGGWQSAVAVVRWPGLLRCVSRCSETDCRRQKSMSRRRSTRSDEGGRPEVMDSFPDRREKAEIGSDPVPQGPEMA